MMQFIIKITMLITFLCAPFVHSDEKPIRMLDHCPNGKGCPEQEYLHSEPYDKDFEITESDYFPVEPYWKMEFEKNILKIIQHSCFGSIHVRASGFDNDEPFSVIEIVQDERLNVEDAKKILAAPEIISLVNRFNIESVYLIRVNKNDKYHDCLAYTVDGTKLWEVACGFSGGAKRRSKEIEEFSFDEFNAVCEVSES